MLLCPFTQSNKKKITETIGRKYVGHAHVREDIHTDTLYVIHTQIQKIPLQIIN